MSNETGKQACFFIIELDQKLLHGRPASSCEDCYFRHEPKVVFHVTDDLLQIADVIKAIQQQFGIRMTIKLTSRGACLPPSLPVTALWEFSSTVIVHPVDKNLESSQSAAQDCNCHCHPSDSMTSMGGTDAGGLSLMQVSSDATLPLLDSGVSESGNEKQMTENVSGNPEESVTTEGEQTEESNMNIFSGAPTDSSTPNISISIQDISSTSSDWSAILSSDPSFAQRLQLSSARAHTHTGSFMNDSVFMSRRTSVMSNIPLTKESTAISSSNVSCTSEPVMGPPSQNVNPLRHRLVSREAEKIIEEIESKLIRPLAGKPPAKKMRKSAAAILGRHLPTEPTWFPSRRSSPSRARKVGIQSASWVPFRMWEILNAEIPPGSLIKFTYKLPGKEPQNIRGKVTENLPDRIKVKGEGPSVEVQYEKAFMRDIEIITASGTSSFPYTKN